MSPADLKRMDDLEIARHFSGAYGTTKMKAAIAMLRDLAGKADAKAEKSSAPPFSAA